MPAISVSRSENESLYLGFCFSLSFYKCSLLDIVFSDTDTDKNTDTFFAVAQGSTSTILREGEEVLSPAVRSNLIRRLIVVDKLC